MDDFDISDEDLELLKKALGKKGKDLPDEIIRKQMGKLKARGAWFRAHFVEVGEHDESCVLECWPAILDTKPPTLEAAIALGKKLTAQAYQQAPYLVVGAWMMQHRDKLEGHSIKCATRCWPESEFIGQAPEGELLERIFESDAAYKEWLRKLKEKFDKSDDA